MATGRKSTFSTQMQAALCRWLRRGCCNKDACAIEGIRNEVLDGRQVGSLLKRIRNHHREHGNLGKRYAEVIRLFNPSFEYGRKYEWQKEASYSLLSQ